MNQKVFLVLAVAFFLCAGFLKRVPAQSITWHFTAASSGQAIMPDSIFIRNLPLDLDTTLYPPDFDLNLDTATNGFSTGNPDFWGFSVSPNFPNPFREFTDVALRVPGHNKLEIRVLSLTGRKLAAYEGQPGPGQHLIRFYAGRESVYCMVLTYNGMTKSLLLNQALLPPKGGQERIVVMSNPDPVPEKSLKSLAGFSFENGNALLMVAYHKGVESGMCDSPISGRDYAFQFSNNGPCSGLDSVFFQDQWYHTRQIMSQCWMKENLNAGIRIGALQNQTNNNILEKHCYQDLESNCETLGGLYTWDEMMQYTAEESAQGICPEGWHVPCDQDWRVLEGIVDSHYPILSIVWGNMNLRGLDAGANLKTTQGWSVNTGTDLYGFSAKPSGYWWQSDYFEYSNFCIFWTSTRDAVQVPIYRGLRMDTNRIFRMNVNSGTTGYSVRCLKNQ